MDSGMYRKKIAAVFSMSIAFFITSYTIYFLKKHYFTAKKVEKKQDNEQSKKTKAHICVRVSPGLKILIPASKESCVLEVSSPSPTVEKEEGDGLDEESANPESSHFFKDQEVNKDKHKV